MLKTLFHYMLISTAVFALDDSDYQFLFTPPSSPFQSERAVSPTNSLEPLTKKPRVQSNTILLPDELIYHIATFARIKDGIQMSSVCKNWKQALDPSDIWERYAPRLAGYEFFKDAPCFKQEDGSIDYKRIIKAATYPFIFIFKDVFEIHNMQRDGSSLLGSISPNEIEPLFSPILNGEEGKSAAVPYTFHSASPSYSPSLPQTVIKNYKQEFRSIEVENVCFHYDLHQGILELIEDPVNGHEDYLTNLMFISKNREIIIGTDVNMKEPIHTWCGKEGKREYKSAKGYPIQELKDKTGVLGQYEKQAYIWSQKPYYALESLNNGQESKACDASIDQTIVVGSAQDGAANNQWRAVKWIKGSIQSLGILNGGGSSKAIAINANGDIIIGNAKDGSADNQGRAVKWTGEDIQPLSVLKEGDGSKAHGMSADGQVIVGRSWHYKITSQPLGRTTKERTDFIAARWSSKGIESLTRLLATIIPAETKLIDAVSVDASGTLIQGDTYSREQIRIIDAYEVPSERYPPEVIKSNDTHQRNADGSFMLGIPYNWETYCREIAKEKRLNYYEYINTAGRWREITPRPRTIILKEITGGWYKKLKYLAFVPREDILEKEGLRAHF